MYGYRLNNDNNFNLASGGVSDEAEGPLHLPFRSYSIAHITVHHNQMISDHNCDNM
jgi:hypothetical protein